MFDTALLYLNVIFTRPVQYPVDYILLKTSCDDYTILHVPVCIYTGIIYIAFFTIFPRCMYDMVHFKGYRSRSTSV